MGFQAAGSESVLPLIVDCLHGDRSRGLITHVQYWQSGTADCLPVDEQSRPEPNARSDGRLQVAQSQRPSSSSEGQAGGVDYTGRSFRKSLRLTLQWDGRRLGAQLASLLVEPVDSGVEEFLEI